MNVNRRFEVVNIMLTNVVVPPDEALCLSLFDTGLVLVASIAPDWVHFEHVYMMPPELA